MIRQKLQLLRDFSSLIKQRWWVTLKIRLSEQNLDSSLHRERENIRRWKTIFILEMSPGLNVVFHESHFCVNKKFRFKKGNMFLGNLRVFLSGLGAKETRVINLHNLPGTRGPAQSCCQTVCSLIDKSREEGFLEVVLHLANWSLQPGKKVPEVTRHIFHSPIRWDPQASLELNQCVDGLTRSEECSQCDSNYQRPDFHQSVGGLFQSYLS